MSLSLQQCYKWLPSAGSYYRSMAKMIIATKEQVEVYSYFEIYVVRVVIILETPSESHIYSISY